MPTTSEQLEAMRIRLEQSRQDRQERHAKAVERKTRRADRRAEEAFQFGRAVIRRGERTHAGPLAG